MRQQFWQQRLSEQQEQVLSPGCVTVGNVVIRTLAMRVWLRERKEVWETMTVLGTLLVIFGLILILTDKK